MRAAARRHGGLVNNAGAQFFETEAERAAQQRLDQERARRARELKWVIDEVFRHADQRLERERLEAQRRRLDDSSDDQSQKAFFEMYVGVGARGQSSSPSYASTGRQAPFEGDASSGLPQVCGGVGAYPFNLGLVQLGVDFSVCSGGSVTLFSIPKHALGLVTLNSSTDLIADILLKGVVPVGPNWFVSFGAGPSFRTGQLSSDQTCCGGGHPLATRSFSQTGLAVSAGVGTFICADCFGGNPLKVGLEGKLNVFGQQRVPLRSIFGFTETGSTGDTTDASVQLRFSVPYAWRSKLPDRLADRSWDCSRSQRPAGDAPA